ncbi:MAG: ribbon-helix-helix protein, CopG family [Firmicutes bacterium]|nr:ribbon-helix-helix protein, CopG family [Bacillota bacterium]
MPVSADLFVLPSRATEGRKPPLSQKCYHDVMTPRLRTLTLRLDAELAEQLGLVARARGMSVAAFVREAIKAALANQAADSELRTRLSEEMHRIRRVLGVAEDNGTPPEV